MSINKVMIASPFILLPDEIIKYETATPRNSVTLQNESRPQSRQINGTGKLYVTNKRIVVITTEGDFQSLNVLLPQIKSYGFNTDSSSSSSASSWVSLSWWKSALLTIGANRFELLVLTGKDRDIGLETEVHYKLVLQFNDGGVYEFAKAFERAYTDVVNYQDEPLPAYSE